RRGGEPPQLVDAEHARAVEGKAEEALRRPVGGGQLLRVGEQEAQRDRALLVAEQRGLERGREDLLEQVPRRQRAAGPAGSRGESIPPLLRTRSEIGGIGVRRGGVHEWILARIVTRKRGFGDNRAG